VSIIQVTHGSLQHFNDIEEDRQALTEMITLSFSDVLFVTPLSTFGGVAQGYGAITPWFIDIRPESKETCSRAQTVDTCYQLPVFKFQCPYDANLNNQWILAKVPYLKDCLPIDVPYGIQLITSRNSTG
jgi:xyloglucan fucosyltransferase